MPRFSSITAHEMREFLGRYGGFLQLWQTYELLLEILIMRTLRLSVRETAILCGSLNYAAKSNIIIALLSKDENVAPGIAALRATQSAAERNDFVHSFLTHSPIATTFHLVRRDVKNGKYNVEVRAVNKATMQTHAERFAEAFQAAAVANNVREEDIDAYVIEIESHAQNQ
jgi:predicted phage tail protein